MSQTEDTEQLGNYRSITCSLLFLPTIFGQFLNYIIASFRIFYLYIFWASRSHMFVSSRSSTHRIGGGPLLHFPMYGNELRTLSDIRGLWTLIFVILRILLSLLWSLNDKLNVFAFHRSLCYCQFVHSLFCESSPLCHIHQYLPIKKIFFRKWIIIFYYSPSY